MRNEPTELGLAADSDIRCARPRRPQRRVTPVDEAMATSAAVLDEAFALISDSDSHTGRIDPADDPSASCTLAMTGIADGDNVSGDQMSTAEERIARQRQLLNHLANQLVELDEQRQRLAQLLQDIDCDALAE